MVTEQVPSEEELARRVALMEKRCNEIIMRMEERHKQDIKNILKPY
jgi:hypothetical protein